MSRAPKLAGVARPSNRDRGATLVIVSLLLATLLVIVALVIDLSFVRNTRQDSKSTADAVAAAGVQSLATADDVVPRPWRAACAALAYLKANEPGRAFALTFMDGDGGELVDVDGVPIGEAVCTTDVYLEGLCVPGDESSWAWVRAVDGDTVVDVKAGYETPDDAFPEDHDTYATDDGDLTRGGCDQIATIVSELDEARFGGIAGATDWATAVRSVGRITIGEEGDAVPAFLMLERRSCGVLEQRVGSGDGIIVNAVGTDPGIIHIDSSGQDAGCGGSAAGNFTVFSGTLGSAPNKFAGIRILSATPGIPGILSLRAHQFNADRASDDYHGYSTTDGVSATPRAGGVVSRTRVDEKYNPSPEPSATPPVKTVAYRHRTDALLLGQTTGFDTIISGDQCNDHSDVAVTGASVRIDCSNYSPSAVVLTEAQTVVFTGQVQVANGASLFMPVAERVVVRGSNSGGIFVTGTGRLGINSSVFDGYVSASSTPVDADPPPVDRACNGREGPAASRTATLTVFGGAVTGSTPGALNLGGFTAMCQTSAYLAGPLTADHVRQASLDTSLDPTCEEPTPCPADGALPGAGLAVRGYVKWSAPNQLTVPPEDGLAGVEDLALWSESSTPVSFGNSGILDSRGVFFLPNARVQVRAPTSLLPVDAQFISRSLELLQGTLNMQPDPANSTPFDVLESVQLVR